MRILLIYPVLFLFAISCAANPGIPEQKASTALQTTVAEAKKPAWQADWEKTLEMASKEGRLVIYSTAGSEAGRAMMDGFRSKYGISVDVTTGRGDVLAPRLSAERRAGIYMVDLYVGGITPVINSIKPAGALDPLEPALVLPEVKDAAVWWGNQLRFVDRDRTILAFLIYPVPPLAVNTNFVRPGEIKSYHDLLSSKWKENFIVNDPTVDGIGQKFMNVLGSFILNYDFVRDLARQKPVVIRDQRLQMEWLAQGKYPLLFPPKTDTYTSFKNAGAPLNIVIPAEGTYLASGSGALSLINRAPHPAAARLFINWLLTREGQTEFSKAHGSQSGRLDVATDHLEATYIRDPSVKYIYVDSEEFLLKIPELMKSLKEIFGPLLR